MNINTFGKHLIYTSPWLYVTASNTGFEGHMRRNGNNTEVYSNGVWQVLSPGLLQISDEAASAIDWAITKQAQEKHEEYMKKKYPAYKSAKDQFDMIKVLCESEEQTEQNNK